MPAIVAHVAGGCCADSADTEHSCNCRKPHHWAVLTWWTELEGGILCWFQPQDLTLSGPGLWAALWGGNVLMLSLCPRRGEMGPSFSFLCLSWLWAQQLVLLQGGWVCHAWLHPLKPLELQGGKAQHCPLDPAPSPPTAFLVSWDQESSAGPCLWSSLFPSAFLSGLDLTASQFRMFSSYPPLLLVLLPSLTQVQQSLLEASGSTPQSCDWVICKHRSWGWSRALLQLVPLRASVVKPCAVALVRVPDLFCVLQTSLRILLFPLMTCKGPESPADSPSRLGPHLQLPGCQPPGAGAPMPSLTLGSPPPASPTLPSFAISFSFFMGVCGPLSLPPFITPLLLYFTEGSNVAPSPKS